jgi:glycerate 2-kinase
MALRRPADSIEPPSRGRGPATGTVLERLRRDALAIFRSALEAVGPERAVAEAIRFDGGFLKIRGYRLRIAASSIRLLAVGKAADAMARGALRQVAIASGLVITDFAESGTSDSRLRVRMASHPLPDEGSLRAGRSALELAEGLRRGDLLLALISGGASSMMEASSVPLEDLKDAYGVLLRSGLGIREINEVRKGMSKVKGGRLAQRAAARGAQVVSLIVSDIVGNPIEDIGSGPTAARSSRGGRAAMILRKAGLWETMPRSVRELLSSAPRVRWADRSGRVHASIVADVERACRAAKAKATALGYRARILTTCLQGEAREAGPRLVKRALAGGGLGPKQAAISGGETTVTVRGRGRGGRNQELALSVIEVFQGKPAVLVSCGTDGIDGNSDAAGAIVDGESFARARKLGLDPRDFLKRNDSHAFFEALKDLIVTGPTGTNVADLQILLVDQSIRRPKVGPVPIRGTRTRSGSGTR